MTEANTKNRWLVVLGAVLMQLSLGALYSWSVFTTLLVEAGWTKTETQIVFSAGLVSFALVMLAAGKKLTTWGPRKLSIMSGLVLGSGWVLGGILGAYNFWVLCVCLGLIGGAGIGLGYVVPIAVGMRWFPDKKGMITGLAVAGFGFGAMGWVKLAGSWGHLLELIGLSGTFIAFGLAFAGLIILGAKWMIFPPEGWTPDALPDSAPITTSKRPAIQRLKETITSKQSELPKETGYSGAAILKTRQYYLIIITFITTAGAGLLTIGLMKLYPIQALTAAGMDPTVASATAGTAMAVFLSLGNGIGRIAWGAVSDKLGRRISLLILASTLGFITIMFPAMAAVTYWLFLGSFLIGFNYGGIFALFPAITADIFGTKNVGSNYPYVFLAYGIGGVLGPILGGYLGDMGNFPLAFTICGISCIVGAATIAGTTPPKGS